jgi:hypothetical protein
MRPRRELRNRFDQIAVRLAVAGNGLSHRRDSRERIRPICRVQQRHVDVREFEAEETSPSLEDAKRLGQRLSPPWHVPDAKGDRVGVKGLVRERQLFSIGFDEVDLAVEPPLAGALDADRALPR